MGRAVEYETTLLHPERTAKKVSRDGWDYVYAQWPNRPSMAKTIRMQQSGENFAKAWRAVQPLSTGEGY